LRESTALLDALSPGNWHDAHSLPRRALKHFPSTAALRKAQD